MNSGAPKTRFSMPSIGQTRRQAVETRCTSGHAHQKVGGNGSLFHGGVNRVDGGLVAHGNRLCSRCRHWSEYASPAVTVAKP
jgi:hypothetical protein